MFTVRGNEGADVCVTYQIQEEAPAWCFFTLQPLLQNLLFPTTAVSLSGTVLLTLIH